METLGYPVSMARVVAHRQIDGGKRLLCKAADTPGTQVLG